jgi:hypothetical protein
LEARGWTEQLSPPPPTYSFVERQGDVEKRLEKEKEKKRRVSSSVYGGSQDEDYDRMSILSFISYYEYYRPDQKEPEKKEENYYGYYYA